MAGPGRLRSALVTGAARRIGRRIALDLAADGWSVALHCNRSREDALAAADEIRLQGGHAEILHGDLQAVDVPQRLISEASERFGGLTCLVNNASCFEPDEVGSISPQSWARHLDTNLRAPVFLAQAFAARLPEGEEGNIINILDQRVLKPSPRFFSYTTSKVALSGVTRTLAQALAPRIRVNGIAPGPTLASARMSPEDFVRQQQSTLLGRGTAPEEVSSAVRFILATPSMTGAILVIDSGQHLLWQTPDLTGISE